ncbi:hypothetical protein CJ030_MR1G013960 [Morella rubra]|uniref:Uncharacterized protein n=1 Tax=Morella rubra TaxID=262757 RepID=A0A6A1WI85_9ROSI|nr:hypothetical protein CJ030_MR1G013960 [Morella rubra]
MNDGTHKVTANTGSHSKGRSNRHINIDLNTPSRWRKPANSSILGISSPSNHMLLSNASELIQQCRDLRRGLAMNNTVAFKPNNIQRISCIKLEMVPLFHRNINKSRINNNRDPMDNRMRNKTINH